MQCRILALTSALTVSVGCSDDAPPSDPDANAITDWPELSIPRSTVQEPGIRRDVFSVAGVVPEQNPVTMEGTPAALSATQVLRYRTDLDPPEPAHAVLIAYPGFLGGANTWDALARHLVRTSAARDRPIEVWAIDRRANGLEDLRGADTAEAAENPEIAQGYYFGGETVGGQAFAGFASQSDVSYMSEWGLSTHVEDLRRVIALIPEEQRRARVVLVGHSMGASFAEAYAAWRFEDGSRGVEELAGIVLIDGVLGGQPLTEEEYTGGTGSGFTAVAGLDEIRSTSRYFELPLLGASILARLEILGMRAQFDPEGVIEDAGRDSALRILLQLGGDNPPVMSNAAALGLGLDDGSNGLPFTAVSVGTPVGAMETYDNIIAGVPLERPSDFNATYTWRGAEVDTPGEFTSMETLSQTLFQGASNFPEWYFPTRLQLDLTAVAGAALPEDGYAAQNGLRAFDGPLNDAPILAIGAGLVTVDRYESARTRVAPAIGPDRVNAGATREQAAGFRVVDASALTHVDPLTGMDRPDNPVPGAIIDFALENAMPGTVSVPVQE